ncbi:MAG TPA: DUF6520 family protein [Ohtaekwangia sp.]
MKRKMIMPLLAVLIAVVGVMASVLPPQQAWFRPALGGPAQMGAITDPNDTHITPCGSSGTNQCKVGTQDAYDTEYNANNSVSSGLLKRN